MQKAYRAIRFYPPDHPLANHCLDELAGAFDRALADGTLRLAVSENSLTCEDEPVFTTDDLREGIPFILFRDGIRSLTFRPGLGRDEAAELIEALGQAQRVDKADHDLVTILWEWNLPHLEYQVADPLLEGETSADGLRQLASQLQGKLEDEKRARLVHALHADLTESLELGSPGPEVLVGTVVPEEELIQLERELEPEQDILEEFGIVLLETLANANSDEDRVVAVRGLEDLASSLLEWGDLARLTRLLEETAAMQRTLGARAGLVDNVFEGMLDKEKIRTSLDSLDAAEPERRKELTAFLLILGEQAHHLLIELLIESGGRQSRHTLLDVLTAGAGVPMELVVPHLGDPHWYVVRNMVYLLGLMKDPRAMPHLEPALAHPDERVRKEAARSVGAMGEGSSVPLLTALLDDPSPAVRVVAVRQLGRLRSAEVLSRLLLQVRARDFNTRSEREIDAFLDTLGQLGDDSAVPLLDELWRGRSFFRSRPLHVRLFALRALSQIGTVSARKSLSRALRSSDNAVRRQAKRGLWEANRQDAASQ
ncbi:MAG TPA: HEAT repeat domain-containing protein [Thermoleophilia bacterium]|nr:HEAT repeat domain-containing protein [Thermoleophilia bacterium]